MYPMMPPQSMMPPQCMMPPQMMMPSQMMGSFINHQPIILQQPRGCNVRTDVGYGQPQRIRDWTSGLFGCCEDCKTCCYAYWCHYCFLYSLTYKMEEHCFGIICGALLGCCCSGTFKHFMLIAPPNTFIIALRSKLRGQHGIKGSIGMDICATWCCEHCVKVQMYREVKYVFGD